MRAEQLAAVVTLVAALIAGGVEHAPAAETNYQPLVGQEGKDVIWVPNPAAMVEKMLDMAAVTAQDFVIDLGSGDGRNVIGAAKRGARARGVEFNPELVEHSRRLAAAAGVGARVEFVQGDMFAADVSDASVLALFLLPDNLRKLTPTFVDMKPGSRIVSNTYEIPGWPADKSETVRGDCAAFCIVFLYVVPARVAGVWRTADGDITFEQDYQRLSGSYVYNGITLAIENARLHGTEIRFAVNGVEYSGRVDGDVMQGEARGRHTAAWRATRVRTQ
jgi:SAM-dependent methyltransferase